MIIPSIKTVFIDVPKVGSSSMTHFLMKAFQFLPNQSSVNSAWNTSLCPGQSRLVLNNNNTLNFTGVRHEPLISCYKNIPDFHDYFFFSMVRNPFDRFKSFVYETLLYSRFKYKQHHFVSRDYVNSLYDDPWYINGRHKEQSEKSQFSLLINHLNIIKSKGWENMNLCSMPVHVWPQVYFLSLKTPQPYTLRILPVEKINLWIDDFKNELSIKSGLNVTDLSFPNIDPVPLTIFTEKSNMDSIKTIPHNDEWELKIHALASMSPDFEFQSKYPTYTSFIKDYKEAKADIHERYEQFLEDNRNLIESVYHDDMVTYGYA